MAPPTRFPRQEGVTAIAADQLTVFSGAVIGRRRSAEGAVVARQRSSGPPTAEQGFWGPQGAPIPTGCIHFDADSLVIGIDDAVFKPGDRILECRLKAWVEAVELPMGLPEAIDQPIEPVAKDPRLRLKP